MYRKIVFIFLLLLPFFLTANAQRNHAAAYGKFLQLSAMFQGDAPYSCRAVVETKYKSNEHNPIRDTSHLIYKNRATYYKSNLVERVEATQGELIINHELQSASFHVSDSLLKVLIARSGIQPDKELALYVDTNSEKKDMEIFAEYILDHCYFNWKTEGMLEEISFVPKDKSAAFFLSLIIRYDKDNRVRYYEYSHRDAYAKNWDGDMQFRVIRTIYYDFEYEKVPNIPVQLSDFLSWNGWKIKLKKYTNYKLSVL